MRQEVFVAVVVWCVMTGLAAMAADYLRKFARWRAGRR